MENIEKIIQNITNPDNTGLPAIIAITKLKRAMHKGATIPDEYSHVDDIFLQQKRADCLQAMGKDAWKKSKDETRLIEDRLELLKAIENYKDKGDFGWQVFGITERDFYWQKTQLEIAEFLDHDWTFQGDYFKQRFNDKFHHRLYDLERETMLSEDDLQSLRTMCDETCDKHYVQMRTDALERVAKIEAQINDTTKSVEERQDLIFEAERYLDGCHSAHSADDREKKQQLSEKRDSMFKVDFTTRYKNALENDNPLQSFKILEELEKDARENGYELDDVLGIEWTEFYNQQDQFLYDAADIIISQTNKLVEDGDYVTAYAEFMEYYSSRIISLEDNGQDVTKITDHMDYLSKIKVQAEFDRALNHEDVVLKADGLRPFAGGGHMSGHALDNLFGEDKANEMRDVAKNAFITVAKDALTKYEASGHDRDLYRANHWRGDVFLDWSDITDDVDALKARVEKNGHTFPSRLRM